MKSSKFQYSRKCRKFCCNNDIAQSRFSREYSPYNTNRCFIGNARLNVRNTRTNKYNNRQIMVHAETQTKEHIKATNTVTTQTLVRAQIMPKEVMHNVLDPYYPKNHKNYQHYSNKSKIFKQFYSRQDFSGAFRNMVLGKKTKRSNVNDIIIVSKPDNRRKLSDFVPQPSAFVHILSAFIRSNFKSSFNRDCGSLVSLRALSKMLEDETEENEFIYKTTHRKPVISKDQTKEVAAISPRNDLTLLTMVENVSPKCVEKNLGQIIELDEAVDVTSSTGEDNEKNVKETECASMIVEDILMTKSNSNSSLEETVEDCNIPFINGAAGPIIEDKFNMEDDVQNHSNVVYTQENECPKIDCIFKSYCMDDYSKERCSISCPCFASESICFEKFECLPQCIPEDSDEIQDILSSSGISESCRVVDNVCQTKTEENDIECHYINTAEICSTSETQENIELSSDSTPTTIDFDKRNNINRIESSSKWSNKNISLKSSSSPHCCSKMIQNQEVNLGDKKNPNEIKNVITIFSRRNRTKLSKTIEKILRMKLGKNKIKDERDKNDFRREVLKFFGKLTDNKNNHTIVKKSFEELTLPEVKLVMPKFSQVKMDIERTTKDRINYFLANLNNDVDNKPHQDKKCTFS